MTALANRDRLADGSLGDVVLGPRRAALGLPVIVLVPSRHRECVMIGVTDEVEGCDVRSDVGRKVVLARIRRCKSESPSNSKCTQEVELDMLLRNCQKKRAFKPVRWLGACRAKNTSPDFRRKRKCKSNNSISTGNVTLAPSLLQVNANGILALDDCVWMVFVNLKWIPRIDQGRESSSLYVQVQIEQTALADDSYEWRQLDAVLFFPSKPVLKAKCRSPVVVACRRLEACCFTLRDEDTCEVLRSFVAVIQRSFSCADLGSSWRAAALKLGHSVTDRQRSLTLNLIAYACC